MKNFILFIFLAFSTTAFAQDKNTVNAAPKMRLYYFVMLKKGPNRSQDSAAVVKLQAGHMAAIERNAANGKLILAGPMGDDGDLRGLFFFKTATIEEAKALVEQDPMVKAGRLTYEIHPWWTMEGKLD